MTISPPDASNSKDDLGPMHWGSSSGAAASPSMPTARQGRRWITPVLLGVVSVLAVAVLASSFITLPYYAVAPGSARPVDELVRSTDRSKLYPHHGEVLFATVTEYRARPIDAIHSWFNDNIELIPEKRILGDNKPGDLTQINLGQMRDSKQTAVAVALRR